MTCSRLPFAALLQGALVAAVMATGIGMGTGAEARTMPHRMAETVEIGAVAVERAARIQHLKREIVSRSWRLREIDTAIRAIRKLFGSVAPLGRAESSDKASAFGAAQEITPAEVPSFAAGPLRRLMRQRAKAAVELDRARAHLRRLEREAGLGY